ncbi:cell wall metabolism sensor histidine kinase WalK [Alkalicoccobacillus murimartini]|uniref:histidine kinase n=1 Tax=Alkalicoccobacillus murimartini TaxID=171685 RepID=A0ABT9YMJ6_9BACI|nr:cell wall metabolism sensor histidine kinase WalK [Alkalicoccobacillus murimartini]MDQ0209110.1 two-component system sensor histidine kinase VicK [Alkalicoccobacillus murimartini]
MDRKIGFFKSIQFKLIIAYVLLILVAVQVIGVYFTRQLEQDLLTNHFELLDERSNLLQSQLPDVMGASPDDRDELTAEINSLLQDFFRIDNATAQVIDKNEVILGTSNIGDRNQIGMRNNEIRVKRALLGSTEEGEVQNPQNKERFRVMAVPITENDGTVLGVIYIQASLEEIYDQIQEINSILFKGTSIALVISAILVILLARTIIVPILEMRKQALRMSHGDFSRQVKVYSTDEIGQLATSFNQLTMKLHDATLTRDREQKRLSSVLSNMTDGVIATDQNGRVILLNKRAEELLGVSSKQVMRQPLTDVLHVTETFGVYDLYDHSESVLLDFSNEDGQYLLEANFSVIQEDEGPINGLITVLHDVTEKEKIEQERREFVANVSHELRTPLTTMKSYLEALEDGVMQDVDMGPRFLKVTQNETERMIRLVNDLLQLSKIDSDDYQFVLQWIDFGQFLHEVLDRFEIIAQEKNINLHRHISKKPSYVEMDQDKLIQVLDNIISNALKYSAEGANITTTLLHQGNHVRVSIADQGMGIPRESQLRIFDRFYRVDRARARSVGGTGLGLAIAKELVQAHGGDIWVHSEYGEGTTIYFTLPYSAFKEGDV